MRVEVLLATMYRDSTNIIEEMNISTAVTVINQTNDESVQEFILNGKNVQWINSKARGLSKSRNDAIYNARNEICLLADDDMYYYDNIDKTIMEVVTKYPQISVFIFNIENINYKHSNFKLLNKYNLLKTSSVQIVFRKKDIIDKGIVFNENFGTGSSKYLSGEENIFLIECFKKGLKIMSAPIEIGRLTKGNSSWFKGFDNSYFYDKGALFKVLFGKKGYIMMLIFILRKYKIIKKDCTLFNAIKSSYRGYKSLET